MKVKIGSWVAGSSTAPPGTVQWAGGLAQFGSGQDYKMVVKSVTVTDANTGAGSYSYGDMSGTWQSIKISGGSGNTNPGTGDDTESSTSSKVSSTAAPTSTKASSTSTKASSTSTKEESSTTTKASSTMTTVSSSSTEAASSTETEAPSSTAEDTSAPTSSETTAPDNTGAASKVGANLAMVAAVVAFFAL
jgi:hypothetical protein